MTSLRVKYPYSVRAIHSVVRTLFPTHYREYEMARYDYCGVIHRSALSDTYIWEGGEYWAAVPGLRPVPVEVVIWNGKRYRIVD